jgi:hypothetical protein
MRVSRQGFLNFSMSSTSHHDFAVEKCMHQHSYKEGWHLEQANQIGIDFLVTGLNVGLTFLETADATSSQVTGARDLDKASHVYRTVVRLLRRVNLSADDRAEINGRLSELKKRLQDAGYHPQERNPP